MLIDGIVKSKHQVRHTPEDAVFVTFRLDYEELHPGSDADNACSVHSGTDYAGHSGSMAVFILDQRPIIAFISQQIILDHFILGGVIGLGADPSGKLRVIGVNTRVNDSNPDTGAHFCIPRLLQIQVIEIGLVGICRVIDRVERTSGQPLIQFTVFAFGIGHEITDSCLVIQGEILQITTVLVILIDVENGYVFRKS